MDEYFVKIISRYNCFHYQLILFFIHAYRAILCDPTSRSLSTSFRTSTPIAVLSVTGRFAHGQFARGQFAKNGPPKVRLG